MSQSVAFIVEDFRLQRHITYRCEHRSKGGEKNDLEETQSELRRVEELTGESMDKHVYKTALPSSRM